MPIQQGAGAIAGRRLLTLAAAGAGGAAASALRIPLPWVLGSMLGVAVLMLLGAGARQPVQGRRAAQLTIGTALGLSFTPEITRQVAALGHWMLLGSVFSIGLTMLFSRAIQRMARMDGPTAIYSVAVGASAEMALQAQKAGADGAQVASAHAIRIILVVSLASVVAYFTGDPGAVVSGQGTGASFSEAVPVLSWRLALLFLVLAPLCGWLADRVRVPNAWLLGPVLLAGAFAASGTLARMYPAALVLAQILIGWSLGQHMSREFFLKSPRMLASASVVTLGMLAICILLAWGLSRTGAIPVLTAFLALAPGGTAEMAIIAKSFGIGAPIVTAFHFFRVISAVLLIGWVARTLLRTGWVQRQAPA